MIHKRKKGYRVIVRPISVKISKEMETMLRMEAAALDLSVSEYIREAILEKAKKKPIAANVG